MIVRRVERAGRVRGVRAVVIERAAYEWRAPGRESVAIRAIAPSLNRNEGRHQLPHCYDTIISKAIKKPEPPEPHPSEPLLNTARRPPGRPHAQPAITEEQTRAKTITPSAHQSSTTNDDNQTTAKTIAPTNQRSNHHMTTRSRATQSQGERGHGLVNP